MTDETTDLPPKRRCPRCRSPKTVKNGRHPGSNAQKMLCRNCGRSFRERYRYPSSEASASCDRRLRRPAWAATKPESGALRAVPIGLAEANAFVLRHHRHHPPVGGYRFAIGVAEGDQLCGVAIVGRPVARMLDDGYTLEVTRCCTDGTRHAASMLYSRARRAAFALGYLRLVTYTLSSESGISLRASGWQPVAQSPGGSWDRADRKRTDKHPIGPKVRWRVLADRGNLS